MSIKSELEDAFKELNRVFSEFKVTATLQDKAVSGYDFGDQSLVSTGSTVSVEGLNVSKKKSLTPMSPGATRVFYTASGKFDPGFYDSLKIGSEDYSIVDYEDNGVFVRLMLKEA